MLQNFELPQVPGISKQDVGLFLLYSFSLFLPASVLLCLLSLCMDCVFSFWGLDSFAFCLLCLWWEMNTLVDVKMYGSCQ